MEAAEVDACPSSVVTPVVASPVPDTHGDEMDTEEPYISRRNGSRRSWASRFCVLEATDDAVGPISGWPQPNPSENLGETASDDDDAPPEVTQEVDRLKALGRLYKAPSVDELLPKRDVYGTRSNELLSPLLVGVGRATEFSTFCGQNALFVIPRSALRRGTKTVRGKFVERDEQVRGC